jgi:hypothetical protein
MKLFMPVMKQANGKFLGILSDTSIDRDNEMMSASLLREWASMNKTLPALVNHENKMEKLVGGWKNLRVIQKDGRVALMAEPFFFSKEANPLAAQVEKQVNEALENGMNVGISIGARAMGSETVMVGDKAMRQYTKAELLEATWVPIQSNPMASFGHVAKSYGLEVEEVQKPAELDRCVSALMADPDFKPQAGRTKEQSAYAVCQARLGKGDVQKMSEEVKEQSQAEAEAVEEVAEQPVEEVAEPVAEEAPEAVEEAVEEAEEASEEVADEAEKSVVANLQKRVAELEAELEQVNKQAVLKATHETGVAAEVTVEKTERSLERMFKVMKQ